jgi:hypothetical protein
MPMTAARTRIRTIDDRRLTTDDRDSGDLGRGSAVRDAGERIS